MHNIQLNTFTIIAWIICSSLCWTAFLIDKNDICLAQKVDGFSLTFKLWIAMDMAFSVIALFILAFIIKLITQRPSLMQEHTDIGELLRFKRFLQESVKSNRAAILVLFIISRILWVLLGLVLSIREDFRLNWSDWTISICALYCFFSVLIVIKSSSVVRKIFNKMSMYGQKQLSCLLQRSLERSKARNTKPHAIFWKSINDALEKVRDWIQNIRDCIEIVWLEENDEQTTD